MSNLPFTLPACDQQAIIRIEVYSPPAPPLQGSLDAVVHVCHRHADDAATAIVAAGLDAHRAPGAPNRVRANTCGHVHVFPTGRLAISDHPRWCDRTGCTDRDEHRSVPVEANPDPKGVMWVRLWLVQLLTATRVTLIEVEFFPSGQDERQSYVLPLAQAITLSNRIRALADLERGGRR